VNRYSADEIMTVTAARALRDGMTCFVGIDLPSAAANLARATHAPNLVLIYESGTIDVGFLGAAQIDKFANINTTVIGADYAEPKVRLPGAGGAPEIAACCKEVIVIARQSRRKFVERVDFITSVGFGDGPGSRDYLGLPGAGPQRVITDLGVLEPDPESCELVLTAVYPGVSPAEVREQTGWDLRVAADLREIAAPSPAELSVLRDLLATMPARGGRG
jgi:glutaconate CoA-transferase subunit B